MRPTPLLMIPIRRCGSHALRLRLARNPHFYSPYPLHIVDFMDLVDLYGDLQDDRNYLELVVDVVGLQALLPVKWEVVLDPLDVFDAIQDKPRSVHMIVWEMLLSAGEKRGAHVVMDKSLDSVHYGHELAALLPDLKFLHVVRDPRAQVVSMNRSIIYDFDISLNAARWADAQRAAERLAERYPTRVLTVRYEDFIADEAAIIARIADYLGLTFTPDMLAVSQSADAHKIAGMSDLWATNAKAPVAANVDKWRTQLSPADVEIIETLTGEYMDRYGYVRETAASAEVSEAQFADAERLSGDLCARAWSCLLENNSRDYLLRTLRANYLRMTRDKLQARLTCVA